MVAAPYATSGMLCRMPATDANDGTPPGEPRSTLERLLVERGMSQNQLAKAADVPIATLARAIRGETVLPSRYVRPVADALGVPAVALLPARAA